MQPTSPCFRYLFLIIAVFLTGLSNSVAQQKESNDKLREWTVLYNLLAQPTLDSSIKSNPGQQIDTAIAFGCINEFPRSMRKHGITHRNGAFTIRLRQSLKITKTVSFFSRELLHWIDSVVQVHDAVGQGANMRIDLRLGTYNQAYINHINADKDEKGRRIGRFGIFIIMVKKKTGSKLLRDDEDKDVGAYDFGGLQP